MPAPLPYAVPLAAIVLLHAAAAPAPDTELATLTVDVRVRAVAPGEPLRVVATSSAPLAELRGAFLGRPVDLVPLEGPGPARAWSGWSLVPLDEEPGEAVVEVEGTTPDGARVRGALAVTIESKPFPEEHLSVAPRYVSPPPEVEARLARERAKLAAIYRSRRAVAPPTRAFVRPVPGEPTSVFGTRRLYNGQPRSPHPGLDLRAAPGTPVRASGPGEVVLAADLYYSGNTVILDHGGGLFTLYAHLSEILVAEGDTAAAGQVVGHSGATGRVTGPHLHWGAKVGDAPFDPTALLDASLFADRAGAARLATTREGS